ncbi:carbohydrate ABC transporter permease [Paenibacillus sp. J2TS4]|uniref:carbohydrate ABC transporter permease n=1 Tax=Paenibacillus sp. J2TS4 TaxID=2807194 RepID=UPI001B2DEFB7|nr:sugar ABC transporter permease [Paenibacillus sp. J2TS4]GIP31454.1 sugar ABC transporter permease [Paenibacillus sp. J2TS4]
MANSITGGSNEYRAPKNPKWKKMIAPYLFVLPNLAIFSVFIVVPALFGLIYSFTDYDGINKMNFIGFENYAYIFQDSEFWAALRRTAVYAVFVVPLLFAAALGIAILLIQQIKGKGIFRAIVYWPTMISLIIVGLTWKWIFGGSFGIANYILESMGMQPVGWLTDPFFANASVIVATLWSRVGFFMVIFMAGLQSIPQDYYEAAKIDGAGKIRSFFSITMPLLKPTSLLVLMLSLIDAFKAYPLMFALTGGGPGRETTYVVQHIYQTGFTAQELGLASAMSVVLFIIIAIFTVFQFRLGKGGAID